MSCVYVPVFTIRLDLAFGFVCLGVSLWNFVWPYLVLSKSETQIYAWVLSLVVFMFAPGPIMFPMGAVALGSICWSEVVLCLWFQRWRSGGTFSKIKLVCAAADAYEIICLVSVCFLFRLFCLLFLLLFIVFTVVA